MARLATEIEGVAEIQGCGLPGATGVPYPKPRVWGGSCLRCCLGDATLVG
jgi:hypothetical protein